LDRHRVAHVGLGRVVGDPKSRRPRAP
jgi:hypothetical protein